LALERFTAEFEMGSGMDTPPKPPGRRKTEGITSTFFFYETSRLQVFDLPARFVPIDCFSARFSLIDDDHQ
jgi:hypothetical protein